jgi:hypothetical protein
MSETRRLRTEDGTIANYIYVDGANKMHNWEGPAYIPNGEKRRAEYYLFGFKMSKEEWLDRKKDVNGVPFHKTAAGKQAGTRV